jgi:hypothetical protein
MPHSGSLSLADNEDKYETAQYFAVLLPLVAELPIEERTTRAKCGHGKPSWPRKASLIIAAVPAGMHKTFRAGKVDCPRIRPREQSTPALIHENTL